MKKIFTRRLCLCMAFALLLNIITVAGLQIIIAQQDKTADSYERLASVKERLAENDQDITALTETLGENNLAKTRAFADLLATDETILEDPEKLNAIQDRLMVSELHVIDEKGIITHSTIEAYIGFDMNSGEQSAAFMPIAKDPSIELVQPPQMNAAEGIMMQYIGVARKDAPGLVQVGIRPEVLENMLAGTQIDAVLKTIEFGETGFVYAIDSSDGLILACPDENLIGTSAKDAGLPLSAGKGVTSYQGTRGKYVSEEHDGMYIGTFLPTNEYYREQLSQTAIIALSSFLIFAILLLFINRLLDQKIIHGIQNIISSVGKIADGDFGITVEEHGTPEFSMLSGSVNKMVDSIRRSIGENEELIARQKADMASNQNLIENIKTVCANLDDVSRETLSTADAIQNGTTEQEEAVKNLGGVMRSLVQELNQSAEASQSAAASAMQAAQKIEATGLKMRTLEDAIDKISNMSAEIEEIIDEINSIAQQTNMLSLNASIEAARVGESGKGFAVVATQVGDLAARSAQAAKQTSQLITNSINAVEEGRLLTKETAEEFSAVVTDIRDASRSVKEITDLVKQNVATVSQAVEGLDVIENVVGKNMEISRNSISVSEHMAGEAGKLLELVE